MRAFHGDSQIQARLIAQLRNHYERDEIVQGTYWQNGKGCAVGCTVHRADNPHALYPSLYGIPEQLAHLEDRIFEGLPNSQAKEFPLQFVMAISLAADLSLVWPRFAIWRLTDETHGVAQYANDTTRPCILRIAELYEQVVQGQDVAQSEFREAADAAEEAGAVEAAGAADAAEEAWNASWATAGAAGAATTKAQFEIMAEKLLELLETAPLD